MAFVKPPKGRAKIVDLGEQIRIEVPLYPLNFREWLFGALSLIPLLGSASAICLSLGMAKTEVLICSFVLYGIFLLMFAFGKVFLREMKMEIVVTPKELVLKYAWWEHRYLLSEISDFRAIEKSSITQSHGLPARFARCFSSVISIPRPTITFNYGAQKRSIGSFLDPVEAKQIVALIKGRFGQYMKG